MSLRLGGLRLQLLAWIVLPFSVILLAVALIGVRVHEEAMRRVIAERDQRAAEAAAAAISQQFGHRGQLLRMLAGRFADGAPAGEVLAELGESSTVFDAGLAFFDAAGTVLAASNSDLGWAGSPPGVMDAWRSRDVTTVPDPGSSTGQRLVLFTADAGRALVVGAVTPQEVLQAVLPESNGLEHTTSAFLLDDEGRLLAQQGDDHGLPSLLDQPGVVSALQGESGSAYLPGPEGEHFVAFEPIHPVGWALLVEEPWASVTSPLLKTSLAAPLVLAPALLVAVIALAFGARQVIEPLRRLERLAARLAEGDDDLQEPAETGIGEIRSLQATLVGMARRIRVARNALHRYIGAITRAQEDERRRLSRELHDETIQDLIALDQRIQMTTMELRSKGAIQPERIEELHQAVNRAIHEVRRLSQALRPVYLEDLGLVTALEMLARNAQADLQVPIHFHLIGEPRRLQAESELATYRIVQEALSNIGRHARAQHAWVEAGFQPQGLTVVVRDDGQGFEAPAHPNELAAKGHFGLMGMHERAELIGATLDIASTPGSGTRLSVHVPLQPAPGPALRSGTGGGPRKEGLR